MAANDPGQEPKPTPKDARLESLEERLGRIKAEEALEDDERRKAEAQRVIRNAGSRILSVLIGYPLGGALIGWALDQWFDSFPWAMLVSMFLGFGLAFREVWVSNSRKSGSKPGDGKE